MPFTAATYLEVSVATPLNFLSKFKAVLSAVRIEPRDPFISAIRVPLVSSEFRQRRDLLQLLLL